MRIDRTTLASLGLRALAVWALAGAALTREVLVASRAADVVAASPLCPPACPAGAAPSWLAVVVMVAWVVLAVGSAVTLAVVAVRRLRRSDEEAAD